MKDKERARFGAKSDGLVPPLQVSQLTLSKVAKTLGGKLATSSNNSKFSSGTGSRFHLLLGLPLWSLASCVGAAHPLSAIVAAGPF